MPDTETITAAESAVSEADDTLKQKQVELLAARQGSEAAAIETAEANLHQAEVELLAAREKLKAAQGQ